jgi:hypothetical protein
MHSHVAVYLSINPSKASHKANPRLHQLLTCSALNLPYNLGASIYNTFIKTIIVRLMRAALSLSYSIAMTFPITNAAVTSTMPKHTYTVMMTTANHGTPTFLHHVQQSNVDLVFIGLAGIFFRKTKLSNWPWNHVFVLSGEGRSLLFPSTYQ